MLTLIIFGVSFKFLLGFFTKLGLIFLGSAALSKVLHIDRAYEEGRNKDPEYRKIDTDE